ncbi:hypothetical protein [Streptomyces sp. NPDC046942]
MDLRNAAYVPQPVERHTPVVEFACGEGRLLRADPPRGLEA